MLLVFSYYIYFCKIWQRKFASSDSFGSFTHYRRFLMQFLMRFLLHNFFHARARDENRKCKLTVISVQFVAAILQRFWTWTTAAISRRQIAPKSPLVYTLAIFIVSSHTTKVALESATKIASKITFVILSYENLLFNISDCSFLLISSPNEVSNPPTAVKSLKKSQC